MHSQNSNSATLGQRKQSAQLKSHAMITTDISMDKSIKKKSGAMEIARKFTQRKGSTKQEQNSACIFKNQPMVN